MDHLYSSVPCGAFFELAIVREGAPVQLVYAMPCYYRGSDPKLALLVSCDCLEESAEDHYLELRTDQSRPLFKLCMRLMLDIFDHDPNVSNIEFRLVPYRSLPNCIHRAGVACKGEDGRRGEGEVVNLITPAAGGKPDKPR
eukprot:7353061-Pyramimonas_sp.AAC.1